MATTCKYCHAPLIFRYLRKNPDGSVRTSSRPVPIHVNGGSCQGPR